MRTADILFSTEFAQESKPIEIKFNVVIKERKCRKEIKLQNLMRRSGLYQFQNNGDKTLKFS